jgi:alpha-glucosidase
MNVNVIIKTTLSRSRERMRCVLATVALAAAVAAPSQAGWVPVGAMPVPAREDRALVFRNGRGTLSVTAVSPEVVRVRFAPRAAFGRDHSYAVVGRELGDPQATTGEDRGRSWLATPALRVTVEHDPLRIRFATARGESLDEDDQERGLASVGPSVRVWKRLRPDEHVYGFGEKNGRLDKRGTKLGGYSFAMWNTDTYGYDLDTDPIYVSVPFFMVVRQGRAHGIFLDNTHRTTFDVGRESPDLLSFGVEGGELDYYFIDGPSPRQVLERYTRLTGRMPLPPLWALAYHQSRYSYWPDTKVRAIADAFRRRRIPADVIWLDIHFQDGYRPFTWDKTHFPDPKGLLSDLRRQGFRVVTIVDPHPKKEPGYAPYDSGLAGDHFVRTADGAVYEAPVWPSLAEKDPGPSVFPDFSRPATREWWGGLYAPFLNLGVAGIWNDMNEPAVFETPTGTMPLDNRHHNEGEPSDHREVHNVYGSLMARSTYEGLLRHQPGRRPFVLSRASFAGGQRYSALWTGDNQSDWSALRGALSTLMGLGLSGFPFVGSDIGGFVGAPTPELYTRWLQAGVLFPFMRTHTELPSPDQEPWSYGPRHEAVNRRAIELRYELLPHIYNVMRQSSDTGLPAMRPLFLDHPEDERAHGRDDQFFFGDDLLAAPVVRPGARERELYLPAGDWYDFWTGGDEPGGREVRRAVTLESLPLYVRAGAFVFRQPVVQHTGEMRGHGLQVDVYPAAESARTLYEDDGESLEYRQGAFLERDFRQQRTGETVTVEVGAPRGTYRPAPRDLVLRVRSLHRPGRVLVGGRPIAGSAAHSAARRGAPAWSWDPRGWATVRLRDGWEAVRVHLEAAPATVNAARPGGTGVSAIRR